MQGECFAILVRERFDRFLNSSFQLFRIESVFSHFFLADFLKHLGDFLPDVPLSDVVKRPVPYHAVQVVRYGSVDHYDGPVVPYPDETFLHYVFRLFHIHISVRVYAH